MNASEEAPRMATVLQQGQPAGRLEEIDGNAWQFTYLSDYAGQPVSLTMPVRAEPYHFEDFPPPFEGLLPEGIQLEALLRKHKIDRDDPFNQLLVVGADLVGSLSVECETKLPEGKTGQWHTTPTWQSARSHFTNSSATLPRSPIQRKDYVDFTAT